MIVYCTHLPLAAPTKVEDIVGAVATWLSRKTKTTIDPAELLQTKKRNFQIEEFVESIIHHQGQATMLAIRYEHRDQKIKGRNWLTEVGINSLDANISCSILLQTRELSTWAYVPVQTTRPGVVHNILTSCSLKIVACSGRVSPLTENDAEAFDYGVKDHSRTFPIVQVSCREDGTYPIHPKDVANLLAGIADVVSIPPTANSFAIKAILGPDLCPYHGAINVLWPPVRATSGTFIPTSRMLAAHIDERRAANDSPEQALLALICHRTNAPFARRHISPEIVQTSIVRAAIDSLQKSAKASDSELAALYREVDQEQTKKISSLTQQLAEKEGELSAQASRLDSERAKSDSLLLQLEALSGKRPSTAIPDDLRNSLLSAISDSAKLKHHLEAIELLFPDRVVVLDSARTSANDAFDFKSPHRAFDLLKTLLTDFFDAMKSGKGDGAAGETLGAAYAAKESESVQKNKRAKSLRTFKYKGRDVEMMRHLKIGVKPSKFETFRCHFHWDAEDSKIVIGHCGKHLDHA